MGDLGQTTRPARIGAAALVTAAIAVALSGCALFGPTGPSTPAAPPSSSGAVVDPSIPSDSPTPTPTAPADTPTPTPSDTPSATPTATPVDAKKRVVPFITSAEWDPKAKELDVSGIVPSVLERNGTCTVTATLGSTTRTDASGAVAASSYTGCETVSFGHLATGSWTVRIAYESPKSAGVSAARTVTVG